MTLKIYKFNITIELNEKAKMPEYKGSMFRGAFGSVFRQTVCVTKLDTCEDCLLKEQCSYFKIFETEIKDHPIEFLKGVKKIPHPFIINPPLDKRRYYNKGDQLQIELVIFGEYIKLVPYFIYSFIKMGEKGITYKRNKFSVLKVVNMLNDGSNRLIYSSSDSKIKNEYEALNLNLADHEKKEVDKIVLDFKSPFRIQSKGNLIHDRNDITPEIILNNLLRRIEVLFKLFGDGFDDRKNYLDYAEEISVKSNKLDFIRIMRYSNRQKSKVPLSGFLGEIILSGNLTEIYPLLKIGSYLNIGKNTVFGLGKYEILMDIHS